MNNLMTHQAEKRVPVFWEKPQKDVSLHTQLVFCTDKALESLTFKTSYEL